SLQDPWPPPSSGNDVRTATLFVSEPVEETRAGTATLHRRWPTGGPSHWAIDPAPGSRPDAATVTRPPSARFRLGVTEMFGAPAATLDGDAPVACCCSNMVGTH